MNILVIEDCDSDVMLLQVALRTFAAEAAMKVCEDGEVAVKHLHDAGADRPDIILLDINLPKKNGHEVLREIKSDPRWADIPVLVFSTTGQVRDIEMVSAYTNTTFITKPIEFAGYQKVVQSIEKLCGR